MKWLARLAVIHLGLFVIFCATFYRYVALGYVIICMDLLSVQCYA